MLEWLLVVGLFLGVWVLVDRGVQEWGKVLARDRAAVCVGSVSRRPNAQRAQMNIAGHSRNAIVSDAQDPAASNRRSEMSTSERGRPGVTQGQTHAVRGTSPPRNRESDGARDPESASGEPSGGSTPLSALVGSRDHPHRNYGQQEPERVVRIP